MLTRAKSSPSPELFRFLIYGPSQIAPLPTSILGRPPNTRPSDNITQVNLPLNVPLVQDETVLLSKWIYLV